MAAGPLPLVIRLLHQRHPRLALHMTQASSVAGLYRDLRERQVDVVFGRVSASSAEGDLKSGPLFNDGFLVVAGKQSRSAGRRKIELSELADES